MKTLILSNSHAVALEAGFVTGGPFDNVDAVVRLGPGAEQRQSFSRRQDGGVAFTSKVFARNLVAATGLTVLRSDIRIGVCMSRRAEALYENADWLTAWPAGLAMPVEARWHWFGRLGRPQSKPSKRPCSDAMLDRMIADHIDTACEFLSHLQAAGINVFAVATPPPKRNGSGLRRGIPFEVARYIQSRTVATFDAWLVRHGIALVEWPAGVADADGFLKPRYSKTHTPAGKRDGYHANADYGLLMMREIDAFLARSPVAVAA